MKSSLFKCPLLLIFLTCVLICCKQKPAKQKSEPVYLPYVFKTPKAEELSVKAFELRGEEKYLEAIGLYQQAITIEPDNPKLFFDVADCYSNINEFRKAVGALDTALLLDSLNPNFYNNRGLVYWKLYEDENAIRDYKKAIELNSTIWVYYSNLALAYYENKMQAEACEAFKTAKKLGLPPERLADSKRLMTLEQLCK